MVIKQTAFLLANTVFLVNDINDKTMPGKNNELKDYQGYFNGPKSKSMTTPLILLDEQGNKWELQNRGTIPIYGDETKREVIFSLAPYIERKPLFTDPCGNLVFEGDEAYFSHANGDIAKYTVSSDCDGDANEPYPSFKNQSDCEKWVNSNVKTMTLLEALEMARKIMHEQGHPGLYIHNELKFKCLLP